jgi:hypothetical protein
VPQTYLLLQPYIGGSAVEISADDYNKYYDAASTVVALQNVEELFAIVASSGIEIERHLLLLTLDEAVSERFENNQWLDDRYRINLLILSFLNSVRAYRDQRSLLFRTSNQLAVLEEAAAQVFSDAYNSSLEYRSMEMVRNHSQHARLPLGKIGYEARSEWASGNPFDGSPKRVRYVTVLSFEVPEIARHNHSMHPKDRRVLTELQALGNDSLDARYYLRAYLAQLATCHQTVRDICNDARLEAYTTLKSLPETFRSKFDVDPGHTNHLEIISTDDEVVIEGQLSLENLRSETAEKRYVSEELCDRLDHALSRWKKLSTFHRAYVSSQLIAKRWSTGSDQGIWIPE